MITSTCRVYIKKKVNQNYLESQGLEEVFLIISHLAYSELAQ